MVAFVFIIDIFFDALIVTLADKYGGFLRPQTIQVRRCGNTS